MSNKDSRKYNQWIYDRCNGNSYATNEELGKKKPPCFVCYVPPCVKLCPWFLERNPFCPCMIVGKHRGFCGRLNGNNDDSWSTRKIVFGIGLICNIIALGLTMFAAFAMSEDYDVLLKASFSHGTVKAVNNSALVPITIEIGLRAIAADNQNTGYSEVVTTFDTFCDALELGLDRYIKPGDCGKCEKSSQSWVASVITSAVLTFPSIFTDFTRMYPHYDLNCQKFYGCIVAFISMILTITTLLQYSRDCWGGFYDGEVAYFMNYTAVPVGYDTTVANSTEPIFYANFDWKPGNGFICLLLATLLKGVDALCNFIIPTPSIAHDWHEQRDYEIQYGKVPVPADDNIKDLELEDTTTGNGKAEDNE